MPLRSNFLLILGLSAAAACSSAGSVGPLFEQSTDVGQIQIRGRVILDEASGSYEITGSGENVWGTEDAFQFVWAPVSGDLRLEAVVGFMGEGGNPHRKAGWMVRSGLEADDPYVDVAIHGDGLIAMQFRRHKGGETGEVRAVTQGSVPLLLERTGNVFTVWVGKAADLEPVGSVVVDLPGEALAGLFVCAHDAERSETARFRSVSLKQRTPLPGEKRLTESTLERFDLSERRRRIVYRSTSHFEAPNWSREGTFLLFNQEGGLYRLPLEDSKPQLLETGEADRCNNDHGFSPDGNWLAISHSPEGESLIYVVPAEGGKPRLVTSLGPSYWHGWSPDGGTLAYCARRNNEYDIYTIPVEGGRETQLTDAPGLDDGPDYSPDGRYIYINSERSGLMKIWRISPDGRLQEQVTHDSDFADWFPHPSPDSRWIVFLSYDKAVQGHPPNQEVVLRLQPLEGGAPAVLAQLYGGQGTLNVPSWSPDGSSFAFVSYRQVLPGW